MRVRAIAALAVLTILAVRAQAEPALTLTTEEYPPLSFLDPATRTVKGLATDLVERAFRAAGIGYTIHLLPWPRAFAMGRDQADTCVYSTTYTDERRPLFKWIGPLVSNDWVLLSAASRPIALSRLDDARPYRIGGYLADAVAEYLTAQGFKVDTADRDELNARKLAIGRIDLWATGSAVGPFLARRAGVEGLTPVLRIKAVEMGLACNRGIDDRTIGRLNDALARVRSERSAIAATPP